MQTNKPTFEVGGAKLLDVDGVVSYIERRLGRRFKDDTIRNWARTSRLPIAGRLPQKLGRGRMLFDPAAVARFIDASLAPRGDHIAACRAAHRKRKARA